jgi:hypothetical protein
MHNIKREQAGVGREMGRQRQAGRSKRGQADGMEEDRHEGQDTQKEHAGGEGMRMAGRTLREDGRMERDGKREDRQDTQNGQESDGTVGWAGRTDIDEAWVTSDKICLAGISLRNLILHLLYFFILCSSSKKTAILQISSKNLL